MSKPNCSPGMDLYRLRCYIYQPLLLLMLIRSYIILSTWVRTTLVTCFSVSTMLLLIYSCVYFRLFQNPWSCSRSVILFLSTCESKMDLLMTPAYFGQLGFTQFFYGEEFCLLACSRFWCSGLLASNGSSASSAETSKRLFSEPLPSPSFSDDFLDVCWFQDPSGFSSCSSRCSSISSSPSSYSFWADSGYEFMEFSLISLSPSSS